MSVIWVVLVVASVVTAAVQGRMGVLTSAITSSAQSAVVLSIGLVGVLTLWLGLMRVAEQAGLVTLLARGAKPVLHRLFPEIPSEHPAMGAMVMNVAANLLGLGNAATPFGIEAMRRLDDLNPVPGTASNAQALFCAINTASIQLVPATVIALRASAGARNPADVVGATLIATGCATAAAIVSAKALSRVWRAPPPPGCFDNDNRPTRQEDSPVPGTSSSRGGSAVPGNTRPGTTASTRPRSVDSEPGTSGRPPRGD